MATKMDLVGSGGESGSDYVNKEYANVKSDIIHITDDKLINILKEFIHRLRKAHDYLTPLSISLTMFITFLTTEFSKDFIGVSKSIWSNIFVIFFIVSLFWLFKSVINSIRYRKTIKIEYLIDKIKNKN
jgi:hypothetical protein